MTDRPVNNLNVIGTFKKFNARSKSGMIPSSRVPFCQVFDGLWINIESNQRNLGMLLELPEKSWVGSSCKKLQASLMTAAFYELESALAIFRWRLSLHTSFNISRFLIFVIAQIISSSDSQLGRNGASAELSTSNVRSFLNLGFIEYHTRQLFLTYIFSYFLLSFCFIILRK